MGVHVVFFLLFFWGVGEGGEVSCESSHAFNIVHMHVKPQSYVRACACGLTIIEMCKQQNQEESMHLSKSLRLCYMRGVLSNPSLWFS